MKPVRIDVVDDATCEVSIHTNVPPKEAWRIFTEERPRWFQGGDVPEAPTAPVDGWDATPWRRVEEVRHPALPGVTRNETRFEAEGDGTRVTQRMTLDSSAPQTQNIAVAAFGIREMLADFAIYAETGVLLPRHAGSARAAIGMGVLEHQAGAVVNIVTTGLAADAAGVAVGDLLTHVGGAAIYGDREMRAVMRSHAPGDVVTIKWVRDRQLHSAEVVLNSPMEEFKALTGIELSPEVMARLAQKEPVRPD